MRGPNQAALLAVLDREHDNLIAALEWTSAVGETEHEIAIAAALGPYWSLRGRYAEGCSWLERVLALPSGEHDAIRVTALIELGLLKYLAVVLPRPGRR